MHSALVDALQRVDTRCFRRLFTVIFQVICPNGKISHIYKLTRSDSLCSQSQDLAGFADENFSVKAWINNSLGAGKPPEESQEAHLQLLIMKLQLSSLDLSNALEELSNSALSSIPRAMVTIEKLRKEAASLRERLTEFDAHLLTVISSLIFLPYFFPM
jgi:hypothetical protein